MTVVNAHAQAVLDLLAGDVDGPPPLVVLDGEVPQGILPPYLLVYMTVRTPSGEMPADSANVEMDSDRVILLAYLHSVGGSARAARMVADRGRRRLLNVTPTIAGRECWPIRHDESRPPDPDETTGALVVDQVDVYRLESIPA